MKKLLCTFSILIDPASKKKWVREKKIFFPKHKMVKFHEISEIRKITITYSNITYQHAKTRKSTKHPETHPTTPKNTKTRNPAKITSRV
jgi:hypothetical protein